MLSTKKINLGGPSKTLEPGNLTVKIHSIILEETTYKTDAMHLILNVEGPDLGEDFEGFYIDKDNHDLGRYKGAIGRIKMSDFPYSDYKSETVDIKRDDEIMKMVKRLCMTVKREDWFNAQDNKHSTIQDFVEQLNSDKILNDIELDMCVAGSEYTNKGGYTNYDLFLPKMSKNKIAFELSGTDSGKLIQFDPKIHIKTKKESTTVTDDAKAVEKFEAEVPVATKAKLKKNFDL